MTGFGSDEHLIATLILIVAVILLDQWLLRTGRIERRHHRVPHYKLRASRSKRDAQASRPASTARLGAGTGLQAGDSCLDQGSAVSVEPPPASALLPTVDAGLHSPASGRYGDRPTTHSRGGTVGQSGAEPAPGVPSLCPGAGLSSRPESVPPDLAPVGVAPHPRGEDVGAASPDLVAAPTGE